jgi:hypothetical protein
MRIARTTPRQWRLIRTVVLAFFQRDGDRLRHKRVDEELARWEELRRQKAEAGRASVRSRTINGLQSETINGRESETSQLENSAENRDFNSTPVVFSLERNLNPLPVPVPVPLKKETLSLRERVRAREARDPPAPEPDASRNPPKASKRRAKPRQRFPDDWLPNPQDAAFAHQRGHDDAWIATNALHCRAHHVAKGTLTTDPAATWRTWVLQAPQFERNSTNGGANGHTGPATAHARAAATVLAEREARHGTDHPADRALLAPKRGSGDA